MKLLAASLLLVIVLAPDQISSGNNIVYQKSVSYYINSVDDTPARMSVKEFDDNTVEINLNCPLLEKKDQIYELPMGKEVDFMGIPLKLFHGDKDSGLNIEVFGAAFSFNQVQDVYVGFTGGSKLRVVIKEKEDRVVAFGSVSDDDIYLELLAVKSKKDFFKARSQYIDLAGGNYKGVNKYYFLRDGKIFQTDNADIFNNFGNCNTCNCGELTKLKEQTWKLKLMYFDSVLKCGES